MINISYSFFLYSKFIFSIFNFYCYSTFIAKQAYHLAHLFQSFPVSLSQVTILWLVWNCSLFLNLPLCLHITQPLSPPPQQSFGFHTHFIFSALTSLWLW